MDLGRFLEDLWSPRGIWESLGDIGGSRVGGVGKAGVTTHQSGVQCSL